MEIIITTYIYIYIYIYTHMSSYMCVYIHIYIYIYMYICMYTRIHTHISIYTHTCIRKFEKNPKLYFKLLQEGKELIQTDRIRSNMIY